MTSDEAIRAAIRRSLSAKDADIAHEIYADDAVLEFPQSGERFVGKQNFLEWRRQYPGDVEFTERRILGQRRPLDPRADSHLRRR